jgi:transposase-like protein
MQIQNDTCMPRVQAQGSALSGAEREELRKLRRENRQLKLEREILAKAHATNTLLIRFASRAWA